MRTLLRAHPGGNYGSSQFSPMIHHTYRSKKIITGKSTYCPEYSYCIFNVEICPFLKCDFSRRALKPRPQNHGGMFSATCGRPIVSDFIVDCFVGELRGGEYLMRRPFLGRSQISPHNYDYRVPTNARLLSDHFILIFQ